MHLEQFPLVQLKKSEHWGRYLVATEDLPPETLILCAEAYSITIFDSFRKRICAAPSCLSESRTKWTIHCSSCDYLYACSAKCFESVLPTHALICPILRKISCMKASQHEKSLLRLSTTVLTMKNYKQTSHVSQPTHSSEVFQLESHLSSWTLSDVNEWKKLCYTLRSMLVEVALMDISESELDLMNLISILER